MNCFYSFRQSIFSFSKISHPHFYDSLPALNNFLYPSPYAQFREVLSPITVRMWKKLPGFPQTSKMERFATVNCLNFFCKALHLR